MSASPRPIRREFPTPPTEGVTPATNKDQRQVAALSYIRDDDANVRVLLITSRGTGRWVLPKGWSKPGESGSEAAAREAIEEAGVAGRVTAEAIGNYRYGKALMSGDILPVQVSVYGLEVERFSAQFPEKGKRVLRWCEPNQAAELVHEPDLSALLRGLAGANLDWPVGWRGTF